MKLESKDYKNEFEKKGLENEKKIDRKRLLRKTQEDLGEIISSIKFFLNKKCLEKIPNGKKEIRKLSTLIVFIKKAVDIGNLESKKAIYKLAQINAQTKKRLNLKENAIKIKE